MNPHERHWTVSRRQMLKSSAAGFGYSAFAGMATAAAVRDSSSPLMPQTTHFAPRARRVIMLFMDGGPSQMDTFDPKPQLTKDAGKEGPRKKGKLFGSPFQFAQYGESGTWISELFPHLAAQHADRLCVVRSMHTDSASHPQAVPFFHTGSFQFSRPSAGAWVLYGLGTENQNLPGFVTINPPKSLGGAQNYGTAFLPSCYEGTRIGYLGKSVRDITVADVECKHLSRDLQRRQIDLVQTLNRQLLAEREADQQLEGMISSLELGSRMQDALPDVLDLSREPQAMLDLYGVDGQHTDEFGRQCLMARRLAEAGVRYIELAHTNWDQHRRLTSTLRQNGLETDQPVAALLSDLDQRGMLDDTLVIWSGEFGRLPEIENGDGRSHNASGFTLWMAGGGVKSGLTYGSTDEYGFEAVENRVHLHDLHATMLHLLGFDHQRLTYRFSGRDFRLTDVHGRVVEDVVA